MQYPTYENNNSKRKQTEAVGPMPQASAVQTSASSNQARFNTSPLAKVLDNSKDTSYVPGGNSDSAKTGLVNAQNQSKAKALASAAAQYGTAQKAYDPHSIDYAAEMQKLYALEQTPEVQSQMAGLKAARDAKIALYPELYSQYKNADFDNAANSYISRITPENSTATRHLNDMYERNDEMYRQYTDNLASQLKHQSNQLAQQYEDVRKAMLADAAKKSLSSEELLATQGLGRGASNEASSGFGESSRMMAQTSLNNNLASSYLAQQQALAELSRQYEQNQLQAFMDYADRMNTVDNLAINQGNLDRDHRYTVNYANANLLQNNRNLDMQDKSLAHSMDQDYWQRGQTENMNNQSILESNFNMDQTNRMNDYTIDEGLWRRDFDEKVFDDESKRGWYDSQTSRITANKKSGSGGGSGGGSSYSFGNTGSAVSSGTETYTDNQAADIVKMTYAQTGSRADALDMLAYLKNSGQISEIMAQNLVNELGLNESTWINH